MNVLLLGSGGREHMLAIKISQSKRLQKLWIAPGNAGTALCGENIAISPLNFNEIKSFVLSQKIDMLVVGPEDPLVKGIRNFFEEDPLLKDVKFIGPDRRGAMLEGSKDFAKIFMNKYHIPTARYKTFRKDDISQAKEFLNALKPPYVLKADGLAGGKGVVICDHLFEAEKELDEMLNHLKFGDAGNKVVIEQFLKGIELSVFIITDGKSYKILPEAKDYKRVGENDTGLNTGGMGAVSPVPFADAIFMKKVEEKIIIPTMNGLQKEDIQYKGFIFIGLMNVDGEPYVIEYNVRMGDPETEVVFPRIKTDILEIFEAIADGNLHSLQLQTDKRTAVTVILTAGGYPGNYAKGKVITGLETSYPDSIVIHAGTLKNTDNNYITNGGRVIAITSLDDTLNNALAKSYEIAQHIEYDGKYFRKDIGADLYPFLK